MRILKILLLWGGLGTVFGTEALGVQSHYYSGITLGGQAQTYQVKIHDKLSGANHSVDAARLTPEIGLIIGSRIRLPSRFLVGLELNAASFFSNIKKNINAGQTNYRLKNGSYALQLAFTFGYFFQKIDTLAYLKMGGEARTIQTTVNVPGAANAISQSKRHFGFVTGFGVEVPIVPSIYGGVEGTWRFYKTVKANGVAASLSASPAFESVNVRVVYQVGAR